MDNPNYSQKIAWSKLSKVKALRLKGAPVSTAVVNAIAKTVVMAKDRCFLTQSMVAIVPSMISGQVIS